MERPDLSPDSTKVFDHKKDNNKKTKRGRKVKKEKEEDESKAKKLKFQPGPSDYKVREISDYFMVGKEEPAVKIKAEEAKKGKTEKLVKWIKIRASKQQQL